MKNILGLVLSLTLIAAVCAGVLAFVNTLTKEPIAQITIKNTEKAAKAVMPKGVEAIEKTGDIFVGKDAQGNVVGYAVKGTDPNGYGGDINLMVGFEADKMTVVCYSVLKPIAETPGLGMNLEKPEFIKQFEGKSGVGLKVKKDGGDIDAITSATITSRAVCGAIDSAAKSLAEATAAEAPAVEAPVVEAPVVEQPVVEAPVVEAPAVEQPAPVAPVQ
ncbi:MAG: RnfABCDGE type electron transport complex subunit G [Kiritimatiellae bacterium]|nr:RnfABCDGE type electron transport complex subunit G [Kiritimatiellia bacterium]